MQANFNLNSVWKPKKEVAFWERFNRKKQSKALTTPAVISETCTGLNFCGKTIKSMIFSTDMALIENNDADAVLAVYPFSPSEKIMRTLIDFAEKPVICGVGGAMTRGKKSVDMARFAEQAGASGIIVNIPFANEDIEQIKNYVNIPVIASISSSDKRFVLDRINAGVDVFHVTAGKNTARILSEISEFFKTFPMMATGGSSLQSIEDSISAGAQSIVLTPPSNKDLFRMAMEKYRKNLKKFF